MIQCRIYDENVILSPCDDSTNLISVLWDEVHLSETYVLSKYRGVVNCVVWSQIHEGTYMSATVQTNTSLSGCTAACLFREVWEPENEFGQSLGRCLVGLASAVSWTLTCGLGVWVAEAQTAREDWYSSVGWTHLPCQVLNRRTVSVRPASWHPFLTGSAAGCLGIAMPSNAPKWSLLK